MKTIYIILIFAATITAGWGFYVKPMKNQLIKNQRELKWYQTNYLSKQGSTLQENNTYLNYHLISLDGGKNWYAIDPDKKFNDKEVKILGNANDVYPKLLNHLNAWDALTSYVEKNGSKDINYNQLFFHIM